MREDEDPGADEGTAILDLIERIARRRPDLEPVEAVLLAAAHRGVAADSRSFAKAFDIAHAHALRALATVEEAGLLAVTRRDARSNRAHYAPTEAGRSLIAAAEAEPQP